MSDPITNDTTGYRQPPYAKPEETQIDGNHYLGKAMQPWDIIDAYNLSFYEGNVLKYLLRRKPGALRITDLRKAKHYIEKCIEREELKTA